MVEYKYNAWGKPVGSTQGTLATTLGKLNPFRYRGYLFDEETQLYYLRSRYYNPEWGRFLNADSLLGKTGALLSHNVFAYCANNPVQRIDPNGRASLLYRTPDGSSSLFEQYMTLQRIQSAPSQANKPAENWVKNKAWPAIKDFSVKSVKSVGAVFMNMKGKAGFGVGAGAEAKVLGQGGELMGALEVFQVRTNPKITSNGLLPAGMELGWEANMGVQIGPSFFSTGASVGSSTSSGSNLEFGKPLDDLTLISLSGYLVIGGSISISVNTEGLAYDLSEIWE